MANTTLTQTGQQVQADLNLLDNNQATAGQVLTADGNGSCAWANASGGGGHTLTILTTDQALNLYKADGSTITVPAGSTNYSATQVTGIASTSGGSILTINEGFCFLSRSNVGGIVDSNYSLSGSGFYILTLCNLTISLTSDV